MTKKLKSKKILVLMENLLYGGVTTHLVNLINSNNFKKVEFVIITNKTNEAAKTILNSCKRGKIKIIYYNSLNVFKFKNIFLKLAFITFKPLFFLFSIFQMYYVLRKHTFDTMLANCGGYGDFRSEMAGIFASKFLGIKNIHILFHHCYIKPRFWSYLVHFTSLLIGRCVSSLIFVSFATKKSIKNNTKIFHLFKNKAFVIHNGVAIRPIKKNKLKLFKTKNNILKILMLSRIEKYKGQMDLIDAFIKLPKKTQNKYKIFFVGSGSPNEKILLQKKIDSFQLTKHFKIINYINKDSLTIISNFDLFISLTRDFEGFGYSIAEAIFAGTPVISTRVGGVSEFLSDKNSELIKPQDVFKISKLLKNFVNEKKRWKKKAMNGRKLIINKYNSELMSKKYFKLLIQKK